jgi:hypothetical protein
MAADEFRMFMQMTMRYEHFMRFLLTCLAAVLTGCPLATAEVDPEATPADEPTCADVCTGPLDCLVSGLAAECLDGRCVIPDIDGEPPCQNDRDCRIVVGTFSGLKEFRCERNADCVGDSYSGPCVAGHSSGLNFCGVPYIGFCFVRFEELDILGRTVELCGEGPPVCVAGQCHAFSPTCAEQTCTCADDTECRPLYFRTATCEVAQ